MKQQERGRPSKKRNEADESEMGEILALDTNGKNHGGTEACEDIMPTRKIPRRAAAPLKFKQESDELYDVSSLIENRKHRTAANETEAVTVTKTGPEVLSPERRIVDFVLHDTERNPQPFEMSGCSEVFITAVVMPINGMTKEKDKGVKCERFGPIKSWSISGYSQGAPEIRISTAFADYICMRPARTYRGFYDIFYQKAYVCHEVHKKLSRSKGGDPNLSVGELTACVARSMSGKKGFPSGSSALEFVASLGEFIHSQLVVLDGISKIDDVQFSTLPVLLSLKEQYTEREWSRGFLPLTSDGSLKIGEARESGTIENEDEMLAKYLQEEEEWKFRNHQQRQKSQVSNTKFYIKINEDEIANDYPLPAYYKPSVEEADEYGLYDVDGTIDEVPCRTLRNWSLYNSDSRFISLELLPLKSGAENDVTVFGSGYMAEDDGTNYWSEADPAKSSSSTSKAAEVVGIPIYLGAIREWTIEFGSSIIIIFIRTDMAWYRLESPAKQYASWYEPVLKTAKLAISMITLLKEQTRVAKLSFSDVIKRVSEFEKHHAAYISSNPAAVERYVVVHGQIILRQFDDYPDKEIHNCAFVTGLLKKMEERHHTKLLFNKKLPVQKEPNLNPSATMGPIQSKREVMRATMTRLINRIWGDYYSNYLPEDSNEGEGHEQKEEEVFEEEQEVNEDEEENGTFSVDEETPKHLSSLRPPKSQFNCKEIKWQGEPVGNTSSGEMLYKSVIAHGFVIAVGTIVAVDADESEEVEVILYVEFLFEKPNGEKMVHGRVMKKGLQTVLGNAANERELFLTNQCMEIKLFNVKEKVIVDVRSVQWGYKHRKENARTEKVDREKAEDNKKRGLPTEYYCKSLYWPEKGAFLTLPYGTLGLGNGTCYSCKTRDHKEELKLNIPTTGFVYKNSNYRVSDYVYIRPEQFGILEDEHGTFKGGRNVGLKAYVVCHLLEIITPKGSKLPTPESTIVRVRRFYRPEDVSPEKAYCSDIREIFYSEEIHKLPVESIEGKCDVRRRAYLQNSSLPIILNHSFFCEYSYDPLSGDMKQLPLTVQEKILTNQAIDEATMRKSKGKGQCNEDTSIGNCDLFIGDSQEKLAALDIFAGCGGLSEGLQKSGVSCTKWGIEYDEAAGEAFSRNHPDAMMFVANCNVILRAIMEEGGDMDECISTAEAAELASKLDVEKRKKLPLPGQVDFINGGPPCQGFSGMNRFNQGTWSKVQCEMILAFLSFADYFRPRFFLLENVRNFISFSRGQTFRLTLASLIEMGYQVRFGVLDAGAYGVSQSRKRAFIWAASPEETLPEWPEPMHVFAGPELKVSLPGNVQYAAVRSTAGGAPFRSITVRDTIGDLPEVINGASKPEIDYVTNPVSWFQKQVRGSMAVLQDHISKEMNELNLIRCRHIPKRPGADWRDLKEMKVKLSSGQMVDMIPWCLPNTAKRHNQWKGLFGRLDWEGNFPTSTTDPQPMGKVGMCFHPEQDRIITVRECARSQGFLDSYHFSGNILNKHRQIGNAVPPPLAFALGRKLKEVVDAKHVST